jgi:hypothetical protein
MRNGPKPSTFVRFSKVKGVRRHTNNHGRRSIQSGTSTHIPLARIARELGIPTTPTQKEKEK